MNPDHLELDLDVNTGRKIQLHESIDRLRRRIDNIQHALVSAHFELLAAFLIDVRRAVNGVTLDAGWQRNWSANLCTGTFRRIYDLARRSIEYSMIESLEPDANILAVHRLRLTF